MLVQEFSPFFNENLLARIKIAENSSWINFFHITESNRTHKYAPKDFVFNYESYNVKYYKLNGKKLFSHDSYKLTRSKYLIKKSLTDAWQNDKIQREFAINKFSPNDDDILIFSDIDEIIDSKFSSELLSLVNKHGCITIPLHYTLYFFNLFSANWYGPPNYSYRVFIMTGMYYKKHLDCGIDELRKRGERGDLENKIFCFSEFAGFHHSWLGDENSAIQKILAYAHSLNEHDSQLFDLNGEPNLDKLKVFLRSGKSVYGENHKLELKPEIELLDQVKLIKLQGKHPDLFL